MKFIKVRDKKLNLEYPWMVDISSVEDLMRIEDIFAKRNARQIMEYMGSKDYAYVMRDTYGVEVPHDGNHCDWKNHLNSFLAACTRGFPEGQTVYPLIYFAQKMDEVIQSKMSDLLKHGRILMNSHGGYFTWHDNLEEIESIEAEWFPTEKKDIKVSKWPEGKHWYVVCDGTALKINGFEKWNTEEEAWKAAESLAIVK